MKGANGAGAVVVARTLMAHVLAVAATVLVLLWCIHFRGGLALRSNQKQLIFNVHPVLMVIGVIVIGGEDPTPEQYLEPEHYAETYEEPEPFGTPQDIDDYSLGEPSTSQAVLTYRSLPAWVSPQARKKAHLALHALGLAVGILGVYAVFKFHVESRIPNLYTLHSWIGIATITLYAIQWLAGFLAFFYPGAAPATRRSVVPWHAVLGLLVFALAVGNAQLGFLEKLTFMQQATARTPALVGKYGAEALLVNFTAIVVLLLGVAVVLATVNIDASRYTAM